MNDLGPLLVNAILLVPLGSAALLARFVSHRR